MKVVLICFKAVLSRGGTGNLNASVHILFTDKLLKDYEKVEGNEHKKVVCFIDNPSQAGDESDSAELVSSAFKENVQEIELEVVCREIWQR